VSFLELSPFVIINILIVINPVNQIKCKEKSMDKFKVGDRVILKEARNDGAPTLKKGMKGKVLQKYGLYLGVYWDELECEFFVFPEDCKKLVKKNKFKPGDRVILKYATKYAYLTQEMKGTVLPGEGVYPGYLLVYWDEFECKQVVLSKHCKKLSREKKQSNYSSKELRTIQILQARLFETLPSKISGFMCDKFIEDMDQKQQNPELKFEVGKFYKTRDGMKAFCHSILLGIERIEFVVACGGNNIMLICTYSDGKRSPCSESPIDIVEEWKD
jgi:signal peptidase I